MPIPFISAIQLPSPNHPQLVPFLHLVFSRRPCPLAISYLAAQPAITLSASSLFFSLNQNLGAKIFKSVEKDKSAGAWPVEVANKITNLGLRCCEIKRKARHDLATEVSKVLEPMVKYPQFFVLRRINNNFVSSESHHLQVTVQLAITMSKRKSSWAIFGISHILPMVSPVLHELRRQFDDIPFNPPNSSY